MFRRTLAPKSIGLLLVIVSLFAGSAAVGPSKALAVVGDCTSGSDWGTPRADFATQVVDLINSHRSSLGLVSLRVSPSLTNAAVWKARHMARYGYMTHEDPAPPVARTVADRLEACGYPSRSTGWGENIAYGYQSPGSVVSAWLNSPGHRANIENPAWRSTGVGAAVAANGLVYWAQVFGTYVDSGTAPPPAPSAPTVSLTGGPASSTTSTSASFTWATSGTVTAVTCSLDGGAAVACASPKAYGGLALGSHTFRVTVSNGSGSSSASYSWSVTSSTAPSAPTVSLTGGPASSTTSTSASFTWATSGTVTAVTCSLDGGAAVACASPKAYSGLALGSHTFRVTVSNGSGSSSASYSWSVTSTPVTAGGVPSVAFTSTPPSSTTSSAATFAWTTSGTVSRTTCSLDMTGLVPCSSPTSYSGLAAGRHTLRVSVWNAAGNSSATFVWTVLPS